MIYFHKFNYFIQSRFYKLSIQNGVNIFRNVGLPHVGNGAFILTYSGEGKQRFFSSKSYAGNGLRSLEDLKRGYVDPSQISLYNLLQNKQLLFLAFRKFKSIHCQNVKYNKTIHIT